MNSDSVFRSAVSSCAVIISSNYTDDQMHRQQQQVCSTLMTVSLLEMASSSSAVVVRRITEPSRVLASSSAVSLVSAGTAGSAAAAAAACDCDTAATAAPASAPSPAVVTGAVEGALLMDAFLRLTRSSSFSAAASSSSWDRIILSCSVHVLNTCTVSHHPFFQIVSQWTLQYRFSTAALPGTGYTARP
jgi:hypothetical protein